MVLPEYYTQFLVILDTLICIAIIIYVFFRRIDTNYRVQKLQDSLEEEIKLILDEKEDLKRERLRLIKLNKKILDSINLIIPKLKNEENSSKNNSKKSDEEKYRASYTSEDIEVPGIEGSYNHKAK